MLTFYLCLLFVTTHLSLTPLPACYLSVNQETQHNYSHKSLISHADHHYYSRNIHCSKNDLSTYSVSDLKCYFNDLDYSHEQILACDTLYISIVALFRKIQMFGSQEEV